MKFHMLFEQSGTFKNVFKSYGHEAYDYDILNDYGQTDFQIDLFKEIEMAYSKLNCKYQYNSMDYSNCNCNFCWRNNLKEQQTTTSIFDDMKPETDFIMAFFPCTYFTHQNEVAFKGFIGNTKGILNNHTIELILERSRQREYFYQTFIKFCFIVATFKIKTIIENPAQRNFLELFSPYRPTFYEKDRSDFGDKFIKPTFFIAINFDIKEQFMMFDKEYKTKRQNSFFGSPKEKSEITPRYADNFYKRFIENQI